MLKTFLIVMLILLVFGGIVVIQYYLDTATRVGTGFRIDDMDSFHAKPPTFVSTAQETAPALKWTRLEDEMIPGMFFPGFHKIQKYQAQLDSGSVVQVEFSEGGRADVKKMVVGSITSKSSVWSQRVDTYVLKEIRGSKIAHSWAHKEFGDFARHDYLHEKYAIVGEYLPIVKNIFQKAQHHVENGN